MNPTESLWAARMIACNRALVSKLGEIVAAIGCGADVAYLLREADGLIKEDPRNPAPAADTLPAAPTPGDAEDSVDETRAEAVLEEEIGARTEAIESAEFRSDAIAGEIRLALGDAK